LPAGRGSNPKTAECKSKTKYETDLEIIVARLGHRLRPGLDRQRLNRHLHCDPPMIPKFIVLLLSGGLDSVTLLYYLHRTCKVFCVLFDYKQKHVQELTFAKGHCRRLGVLYRTIELPKLGGLTPRDWVVPFRNPIMLSVAANVAIQARADEIAIGCNMDDRDQFPDCRWEVMDAMNHALTISGYKVQIVAPFLEKSKREIVEIARNLNVPMHEIWTCYRGGARPCGKCLACKKLEAACA
jgi:7-cyano-7-deazaguanine synthase